MSIVGSRQLIGRTVVSQDGAEVGEVQGIDVDVETWKVVTLEIRLERAVLERLNLKKPVFGTQSVRLLTDRVSGVSDTVVLKNTIEDIAFVDRPDSGDDSSLNAVS